MKNNFEQQSGFTLLELLVVIAIIGLLAGIIAISIQNARERARDAKRSGDVRQLITALEQYYVQNGTYPTGSASVASVGTGALFSDSTATDGSFEPLIPNYIPILPQAPEPADGDCGNVANRGNNNYWYDVADDGTNYTITFCLGKDSGSWQAGIRSATPSGVQ